MNKQELQKFNRQLKAFIQAGKTNSLPVEMEKSEIEAAEEAQRAVAEMIEMLENYEQ